MDDFCGNGSFWDTNLTWYNNKPDFTPCFEQTVLTWIPCGFLWFFAVFEVFSKLRLTSQRIPMTPLIILKCLGSWALIIVQLTGLSFTFRLEDKDYDISRAERYSSIVKIASYMLTFILLMLYKAKGVRTSGTLFLFWLLSTICEVFPFQTALRNRPSDGDEKGQINFQLQMINYPLIILMLLFNCWADAAPIRKPKRKSSGKENGIAMVPSTEVTYKFSSDQPSSEDPQNVKPCPEASASYLSKLIFFWFESLAWKGYRNPLVYEDLWDLNEDDLSRTQYPIFEKNWKRAAASGNKASVFSVLVRTFGGIFLVGASLKFVQDCLTFVPPRVLKLLISYVKNGDEEGWKGFLYVGILFATSIIQTIFLAQYFHKMFVLGMRIKASVTSAVYRKALKISNAARKESTTGEIVNLMSVDVQRLMDLVAYLNMLWSAPFQIGVALYFLWDTLGPSVLSGVAVMILLIPVNGWLAGKVKNLHGQQMKNKDNRVKLMSEILSGIKVLKLYAWELSFKDQVHKIRDREMIVLRKAAFLNAGTTFLWFCAPFVVALVTFATYVLVDEENVLDSEKAFVALTLFNIMSMPMTMLPMMIVDDPVVIEDGDFAWEAENKTLTNINVRIKPGQLVAVVGIVGSGMQEFFDCVDPWRTNQTQRKSRHERKHSVCSQQAWIRNCTLKDNITFGKPFDKQKYNNIIDCCALKPDLDILPAGDQTEIGEKGVNLSGVSLARAAYCDTDVYLFDDPLSAVDSHVGKHIFDKMLGPQGLLAGKTRLLVTHGITYLPQTDHIIVLKDGQISEEGTYKQLLAKKGAFADFLVQHLEASEVEDEEFSNVVMELEQALGGRDKILQRQQSQISDEGSSCIAQMVVLFSQCNSP
ncbi:Multidrug resistance-associated protein 1, partial [Orchesella cincta]